MEALASASSNFRDNIIAQYIYLCFAQLIEQHNIPHLHEPVSQIRIFAIMRNTANTIFKNASVLLISQLATWGLTLALTVVLARYLGAELVGEYTIASSLWTIMGVIINFGMDTLLVKEIARSPEKTPLLLSATLGARTILFILSCGLIAVYIQIANFSSTAIILVILLGIAQLITQLYLAIQASLQGLELMHYVSIANVMSRIVNTVLGIAVLVLGYGVYGIGFVTSIAMGVGLVLQYLFLRKKYPVHIIFNAAELRRILRTGLPYLASSLGLVAYGQVDVIVISSLINTTQVGWYGSASRLFSTMMFFPVIFTTAIFPSLTRIYTHTPNSLPRIIQKSFNLMLVLSTPIGVCLLFIAKPLVVLLYGNDFSQSGPVLAILGLVLIPTYQNILLGQFLTSTDRQNRWTVVMLLATAATLPLDLLLVPWCQAAFDNGAIAGALSFLITEIGMVIIGITFLPNESLNKNNIFTAIRICVAGGFMAYTMWLLADFFMLIPALAGTIVYIGMILMIKAIPAEDLLLFKQFALSTLSRLHRNHNEPLSVEGA